MSNERSLSGWRLPESRLATIGGLVAILLWSCFVSVCRSVSEQVGGMTAAAAVMSMGAVLCILRILLSPEARRCINSLSRRYLGICGCLFSLYLVLVYLAVYGAADRQQVLDIGILNYLWPVLTIMFAVVLLKHRTRMILLLPGAVLALAGVSMAMGGGEFSLKLMLSNFLGNMLPYLAALTAAIVWALYSVLARRFAGGTKSGGVLVFIPLSAILLLTIAFCVDEPRNWSVRALLEIVFLGGSSFLAYDLWDGAMRKGNVVLVAAASYFTPLLSTVISCVYLGVFPGMELWVGCGLIVVGSFMTWRSVVA